MPPYQPERGGGGERVNKWLTRTQLHTKVLQSALCKHSSNISCEGRLKVDAPRNDSESHRQHDILNKSRAHDNVRYAL